MRRRVCMARVDLNTSCWYFNSFAQPFEIITCRRGRGRLRCRPSLSSSSYPSCLARVLTFFFVPALSHQSHLHFHSNRAWNAITKFIHKNKAKFRCAHYAHCTVHTCERCLCIISLQTTVLSHSVEFLFFFISIQINENGMDNLRDTYDAVFRSHCSAASRARIDCCKCHPTHSPNCRPTEM